MEQAAWLHPAEYPLSTRRHVVTPVFEQDAEEARQRRSRFVQILTVPRRVRLGSSLAAALPDGPFEHPEWLVDIAWNFSELSFFPPAPQPLFK